MNSHFTDTFRFMSTEAHLTALASLPEDDFARENISRVLADL